MGKLTVVGVCKEALLAAHLKLTDKRGILKRRSDQRWLMDLGKVCGRDALFPVSKLSNITVVVESRFVTVGRSLKTSLLIWERDLI
jgi:hypothetical protein